MVFPMWVSEKRAVGFWKKDPAHRLNSKRVQSLSLETIIVSSTLKTLPEFKTRSFCKGAEKATLSKSVSPNETTNCDDSPRVTATELETAETCGVCLRRALETATKDRT